MVLSLYLRSTLSIIFFPSLDKFGGAFEEPFLRLEDRTRPMRRSALGGPMSLAWVHESPCVEGCDSFIRVGSLLRRMLRGA